MLEATRETLRKIYPISKSRYFVSSEALSKWLDRAHSAYTAGQAYELLTDLIRQPNPFDPVAVELARKMRTKLAVIKEDWPLSKHEKNNLIWIVLVFFGWRIDLKPTLSDKLTWVFNGLADVVINPVDSTIKAVYHFDNTQIPEADKLAQFHSGIGKLSLIAGLGVILGVILAKKV